MNMFDYIVVGAGINGSWTAYHLAKMGHKVLLLEKFPLPHSRGSSHGQSRIIRKAYRQPFFNEMMHSAYQQWHDLEEKVGMELMVPMGLLCFGDNSEYITSTIQTLKNAKRSSKVEFYDKLELEAAFPDINFLGDKVQGLLDLEAGVLRADKALIGIQRAAVQLGVTIKDSIEFTNLEWVGDNLVRIEGKGPGGISRFEAKGVVLCAGPWSMKVLEKIGMPVKMKAWKIPVTYFPCAQFMSKTFVYDNGVDHFYGVPDLEYPGLVKICRHIGDDTDPDERDHCDSTLTKAKVIDFVTRTFPTVDPRPVIEESCLYTMSPDDVPVLDRHPKFRNIVVGCGFSGTGFKLGPVTGEILALLVTDGNPIYDLRPFRYNRF
ncbi:peroxisomal sarcosine oxidase-like [Tigriopus californicus]|uniref:peroxisomal sarcosine oxidase-like n=1 Tax=Tigriopus californicus TaxID=6832 RepID=UPI0027DA30D5|nr:peroxisomal sarcosine oxidase-like [Tigriopus californicus]